MAMDFSHILHKVCTVLQLTDVHSAPQNVQIFVCVLGLNLLLHGSGVSVGPLIGDSCCSKVMVTLSVL